MKRGVIGSLLGAGLLSSAIAQTSIVEMDFSAPLAGGPLAGQAGWETMPNTGAGAFEVNVGDGTASTAPVGWSFDSTAGNYLYFDQALSNAQDTEWSGVLDFSLSTEGLQGAPVADLVAQEIFEIGLTSAATNRLHHGEAGDVSINLRRPRGGGLQVTLSRAGNGQTLASLTEAQLGWDPGSVDDTEPGADLISDALRIEWQLRKARNADTYSASATLQNLAPGGAVSVFDAAMNVNYVTERSNAYDAATLYLAMGHNPDADDDGTRSRIDITIDELSVNQRNGVTPVFPTPVLSADPGSGMVDLSWGRLPDATSYTLERGTVSGIYDRVLGVFSDVRFSDADVVDGQVYYYRVTAHSAGVADAVSAEVEAQPLGVVAGAVILDEEFALLRADHYHYENGDLAGQARWRAAEQTAPLAFSVTDAQGLGFAETASDTFDGDLGNGVYYNTWMRNEIHDAWTGSVTFALSIDPLETLVKTRDDVELYTTNVVGELTTIITNLAPAQSFPVSGIGFEEVFQLGLTTVEDRNSALTHAEPSDLAIVAHTKSSDGKLYFYFNDNDSSTELASFRREEIGWDPSWRNNTTNGPVFETLPIRFDWYIMRTDGTNYLARATAICGTETNESEWIVSSNASVLAEADAVLFGVCHDASADNGKHFDTNENLVSHGVQVSIDSIYLEHLADEEPILFDPGNPKADASPNEVEITWQPAISALRYIVRRYEDFAGEILLDTQDVGLDLSYVETGLDNRTMYFYTVSASYGIHGERTSEMLKARPMASMPVMDWLGGGLNVVDGHADWNTAVHASGGLQIHLGNGVAGSDGDLALWDENSGRSYTIANTPRLYGFCQLVEGELRQTQIRDSADGDHVRIRCSGDSDEYFKGLFSALVYVDASEFDGGLSVDMSGGADYSILLDAASVRRGRFNNAETNDVPGTALRIAIRNGNQWYASRTHITRSGPLTISSLAQESWAPFEKATSVSAAAATVHGADFAPRRLNNVQAIGFFADQMSAIEINSWEVKTGDVVSPFTLWCDGFDLYNEPAGELEDADNDGTSNLEEWAFGGDPTNSTRRGFSPSIVGPDESGENLIYVYPKRKQEPRPTYTVVERRNLTVGSWADNSAAYTVQEGDRTPGNTTWLSVTNWIPIDYKTKFIGVSISN